MSNRLIFRAATLVAIALVAARALPAAAGASRESLVPISSYDDDPFADDAVVERMSRTRFEAGPDGRLALSSDLVAIEEESVIYRFNQTLGRFVAFAWNPWSPDLRKSNAAGNFAFPDEERFPLHRVERDADGKVVLVDGLQHWLPQDLHRGMTTVFESTNAAKDAAELWSGRELVWGQDGYLEINAHAFIDFNAFFSPSAQALFFGVVPHRLPGEPTSAPVKMFETATSWDLAVHEAGHALFARLKPNRDFSDAGCGTWSESFGDQIQMWASLRDADRVLALVAETDGNLAQSNSLTRFGEAYAALLGEGTALRDAFHDRKVSDTTPEVHDRSEPLTGAAYRLFLAVYEDLARDRGPAEAATEAAQVLGVFLTRATDFTPENRVTLEDVAKGYLEVDAELFDGRYRAVLVDELLRRELFDAGSLDEWLAHEAATPELSLRRRATDREVERWLQANLDALGVGPEFGLALQSVTRGTRRHDLDQTVVRVQLTLGRGEGATPLDNHGVLVFRASGALADYHAPLPPSGPGARTSETEARAVIADANQRGLGQRGVPLALVRDADGRLTAEARVLRGEGLEAYMEVFTLDDPSGERREIVIPPVPPDRRMPIPDEAVE
jgi:hypothetical protein